MIDARPIIFSAPMVRAILDDMKTQTRRKLKAQPQGRFLGLLERSLRDILPPRLKAWFGAGPGETASREIALPYKPGDLLWVRESFSGPHCHADQSPAEWPDEAPIWYWADGNPTSGDWTRPKPSIHMPRWASRITLLVTDVRVQRLRDISEADAQAEGTMPLLEISNDKAPVVLGQYVDGFRQIWTSIHGPDAWEKNPWVAAISFKRVSNETGD